jgi:hypothetical protein
MKPNQLEVIAGLKRFNAKTIRDNKALRKAKKRKSFFGF